MKRTLTRIAIMLITLNAALAVSILALGRMGDTEGRILGTSLLATLSALLAMVQVPALREGRLGIVPASGMTAAGIGFIVATAGIWAEPASDTWWQLGGSGYTIASAGAVVAILSGWPIRGRTAWIGTTAPVLIGIGTVMILGQIWFEFDSEVYGRAVAVLAVLIGATGLAIPILHRSSVEESHLSIGHCPFCGVGMSGEPGSPLACEACNASFSVRVGV